MYKPIIGLEIHTELNTELKMFCSCLNDPDEKRPNVNICPVCLGHPGTLPVTNQKVVKKVIKTGLALNCQISKYLKFDRKNYFYPDLPKGYQISQLYHPLCRGGFLKIDNSKGEQGHYEARKKIRIREIHLEEDVGKLIHPKGADYSLVDFNRAGIPLMELVTEPEISSAEQARKFAEELQLILKFLKVSDADMEKGQMRIEANISLTETKKLGTKVEIKNLNSFKILEKAINYEIKRQTNILKKGGKVVQETRGWDEKKEITFSQRSKEEAHDYRYFPEPDLPTLKLENVDRIKAEILELPQQKRERFKKEYKLPISDINILINNELLANFFENVCSEIPQTEYVVNKKELVLQKLYKLTVNYLITEIQKLLYQEKKQFNDLKITAENFAEFIVLVYKGIISSSGAQVLLKEMFKTGADPTHIIKLKNLAQITNEGEIEKIIQKAISKNPKAIEDYKKGKQNALQFIIGQIMAQSKGKASPQIVQKVLIRLLAGINKN